MAGFSPEMLGAVGLGAGLLALGGIVLFFVLILALAMYVYTSLALMTIGKKLRYKHPWLAWIPIANIAMVLQMGGFHWAWVFLILVPILGWLALVVLGIIATWRVYEKRKYPGWLSLVPLAGVVPIVGGLAGLAHMVIIGFVAWKDVK